MRGNELLVRAIRSGVSMAVRRIRRWLEPPGFISVAEQPESRSEMVAAELRRVRYLHNLQCARSPAVAGRKPVDQLIVSLTSHDRRIEMAHEVIESLLSQTIRPEKIILWLDRDRFSMASLPPRILEQTERGLTVAFRPDKRSHMKLVYALVDFPDAAIVTADDDLVYPDSWLETLYRAYQTEPQYIHCHRMHLMTKNIFGRLRPYNRWHGNCTDTRPGRDVFPTTGAGVLYPPGTLHPEVVNEKQFVSLCPTADDVWFKVMSLLQGTLSKRVDGNCVDLTLDISSLSPTRALWSVNRNANDRQLKAALAAYKIEV